MKIVQFIAVRGSYPTIRPRNNELNYLHIVLLLDTHHYTNHYLSHQPAAFLCTYFIDFIDFYAENLLYEFQHMFLVYRIVSKLMRLFESAFLLKVFLIIVSRVQFYFEEKEFTIKVILFLSLDIFCFQSIYIYIYICFWLSTVSYQ